MFKSLILLLIVLPFMNCKKKQDSYLVRGKIDGYNNHYLYMTDINNIFRDSVLVREGMFEFKGVLPKPTAVYFETNAKASAIERNVYIENKEIVLSLKVEKKGIDGDFVYDWIVVDKVYGTRTDSIYTDYMKSSKNGNDYYKLSRIIKNNSNNGLSSDLLFEASLDTTMSKKELKELYAFINWDFQEPTIHTRIKLNVFPEDDLTIGKRIIDFELIDQKGDIVSTKDYRGTIVLIDFWASWCAPCREAFPELSEIYLKNKGFEIMGVSIDDSKENWLKAIETHDLQWRNAISLGGFKSTVAQEYRILEIPTNYLIDPQGIILAKNIGIDQLNEILKEKTTIE